MATVNQADAEFSVLVGNQENLSTTQGRAESLVIRPPTRWGATIELSDSSDIDRSRQDTEPEELNYSAGVEFPANLNLDNMRKFLGPILYAEPLNNHLDNLPVTATDGNNGGFQLAGATGVTVDAGTLLVGKNFEDHRNNGLHVVAEANNGQNTNLRVNGLQAQTGAGGRLYPGGRRVTVGSNASYTYTSMTKTAALVFDAEVSGLRKGMRVFIGSLAADGTSAQNAMSVTTPITGASHNPTQVYGRCRVVSINTVSNKTTITFDKLDPRLRRDAEVSGTIDLRFGIAGNNAAVTNNQFRNYWMAFQRALPGLGNTGNAQQDARFSYVLPCRMGDLSISLANNSVAEMTATFEGKCETEELATARMNSAGDILPPAGYEAFDNPLESLLTAQMTTTRRIKRVRFDQDQEGVQANVVDVTHNFTNNVGSGNYHGGRGSERIFRGRFRLTSDFTLTYEDPQLAAYINQGARLSYDETITSNDGSIDFDIPSFRMTSDGLSFPENEDITIAGTARTFRNTNFDSTIMIGVTYDDLPDPAFVIGHC